MKVALCIAIALAGFLAAPTGVQAAGVSCQQADVTDDGRVTLGDLSELAAWFLKPNPPKGYDLDGDGRVTVLDLAAVAARFGEVCDMATTVNITAGGDDGYWFTGTFNNSDVSFAAGNNAGILATAFLRFDNVLIPPGATIVSAIHRLGANPNGTPLLKIYAEDADDPTAVTSEANGHVRVLTTAAVDWDDVTLGVADETPDLAAIIQEIVDRPGWQSGNAMQFFYKDDGSASSNFALFAAFEDVATEASLIIEYAVPPSPGAIMKIPPPDVFKLPSEGIMKIPPPEVFKLPSEGVMKIPPPELFRY